MSVTDGLSVQKGKRLTKSFGSWPAQTSLTFGLLLPYLALVYSKAVCMAHLRSECHLTWNQQSISNHIQYSVVLTSSKAVWRGQYYYVKSTSSRRFHLRHAAIILLSAACEWDLILFLFLNNSLWKNFGPLFRPFENFGLLWRPIFGTLTRPSMTSAYWPFPIRWWRSCRLPRVPRPATIPAKARVHPWGRRPGKTNLKKGQEFYRCLDEVLAQAFFSFHEKKILKEKCEKIKDFFKKLKQI